MEILDVNSKLNFRVLINKKTGWCFILSLIFIILVNTIYAQNTADKEFAEILQETLDESALQSDVIGGVASVVFEDSTVWHGATGYSDPLNNIKMQTDMLFNIGSISKTYIAVLTLKMVEQGRLSLNDTIGKWFADYANINPKVTVAQLLNHTSGLFDYVKHEDCPWQNIWTTTKIWQPEEILRKLVKAPYFEPGEGWHYSNTNYLLLKEIIDKITDNQYVVTLIKELLDPYAFKNTVPGYMGILIIPTERSPVYWRKLHGIRRNMSATGRTWESLNYRILTTAGDLAAWTDALYHRKLILSDDMLTKMLDFHTPTPNDYPLSGYGYGVCSFKKKEANQLFGHEIEMIGHVGNGTDYKSIAVYLPEHAATISLLINEDSTAGLINIFSKILADVVEYRE